jgi:two-component system, NarL family, sensor histidine kinase UhpB
MAQPVHSKTDSLLFEQQLAAISKAEDRQDYNMALSIANEALNLGRRNNFPYGEAWALIKINEILIDKGDYTQSNTTSKIIQTGNQLGNKTITGIGHLQAAQYKMHDNKPTEAESYFEKALRLLPPDNEYAALCWNERGYNASLLSDLQKQTECYLNALRLYEKQNNRSGTAMTFSNLSALYNDLRQNDKAIQYAKKAITIREELHDTRGLTYSYCNLSQLYLDTDLKEAEKYAVLCTKAAEQLKDGGRLVYALSTSGLIKDRQGRKAETLAPALEIMKILKKNRNPSNDLARQYLAVGIIMSELKMDSVTTLDYFNKGLNMALELGDKVTVRDAHISKTIFFKQRNDFYNAYENIKKYHSYKDSIINSNTQTNIAELQTRYETEKKDNEITRLNAEQRINQLQIEKLNTGQRIRQLTIEKQNAVIAGNKLLARQKEDEIILLSKERELLDLEVKQQTENLVKQQLLAKTQAQQLELAEKEKQLNAIAMRRQKQSRQLIIGAALALLGIGGILFNRYQLKKRLAEQEKLIAVRDLIARDLHDEVGSALSSIKILSEVSQKNLGKDPGKSAQLLSKVVEQSEQMQQSMSDIVWAVKPDNDKMEDISIRMREYISRVLEPKNIAVNFQADEKALAYSIGMQQRRDLLMIFKEAVNNIAKHSLASTVGIYVQQKGEILQLVMQDNGRGFDPGKITSSSGLKNMKARAAAMGGSLHIASTPQKGSSITLNIHVI